MISDRITLPLALILAAPGLHVWLPHVTELTEGTGSVLPLHPWHGIHLIHLCIHDPSLMPEAKFRLSTTGIQYNI